MKKNTNDFVNAATRAVNGTADVPGIGPPYGLSALSCHYGVPSLGSDGIFDVATFGQPVLERPWKANIQPTLNKEGHLNTTGVRMTPISGVWQQPMVTTALPEELAEVEDTSWREVADQALNLVKRLIACGVEPDFAANTAVKLLTSSSTKGGGR